MKRVEGYLAKAITADVARLTLTYDRKVANPIAPRALPRRKAIVRPEGVQKSKPRAVRLSVRELSGLYERSGDQDSAVWEVYVSLCVLPEELGCWVV
jgi:hypothetical protein